MLHFHIYLNLLECSPVILLSFNHTSGIFSQLLIDSTHGATNQSNTKHILQTQENMLGR
jgi:hypothetical protein